MLNERLAQSRRDLTSIHADPVCFHLKESGSHLLDLFNDVEQRLLRALTAVFARAELIAPVHEVIARSVDERTVKNDLADTLILQSLRHHAAQHPDEEKVFLSGNSRDFGTEDVRKFLRGCAIGKYFTEARPLLDWLNARSSPNGNGDGNVRGEP
jgi:hypothetical protein